MDRAEEIRILEELIGLKQADQFFLDDSQSKSDVRSYLDKSIFENEQRSVFGTLPVLVAHSSEVMQPNSFVRRSAGGRPLLVVRGGEGSVRIFLNVCRHRGMRLVGDDSGCKQRFTCPYHAWTWDNTGQFLNAPHLETGFPESDRSELGLVQLPGIEKFGFVWLLPGQVSKESGPESLHAELINHLGPLARDFDWFNSAGLVVHASHVQDRRCNWKIVVEGGLEAYHFRVAHRNTIAGLFNDNLSSYQVFGRHIRSVLPRASILDLQHTPNTEWKLRDHAQVLYSLLATSMLLVQTDHIDWISLEPVSVDQCQIRITSLVPPTSQFSSGYWDKNHALTVKTLNEDFDIAEGIQAGLASGANEHLNFGRFEGALKVFNEQVKGLLAAP